jgi:hypothetical protein
MERPIDAQSFSVRTVDEWVVTQRPSVEDAAAQVAEVRRLAREVRMAEAHLVGYLREELHLAELADIPEGILGTVETDD